MLKRAPVGPQSRSQQWSVTPKVSGSISVPAKFFDGVAGGRYYLINTLPLWKQFFAKLIQQKIVACDTETDGLGHRSSKIIGWCFSWGGANSYYIPVCHYTNEKQLRMEDIWDDLKLFFSDPNRTTIWHNGKFDLHFLWNEGLLPAGLIHDTRIMQSLLNETMGTTALKKLAVKDIHKDADRWEKGIDEFRAKFAKQKKIPKATVHYGYIPIEMMTPYAASDAHYTWVLYKKKLLEITQDSDLVNLYVMEMELLWVLLTIEHEGVFVDRAHLEKIGPDLDKKAADLRAKIISDLGDVNPDSNVTLIDPLIQKGVKLYKKTKTGRFSLDVEVLNRLSSKYQVCADIVGYRQAKKIKSTYVDSILEKLSDDDRLHCEYNQAVSTGRMSSKAPNLQNIPAKDKSIRKSFVPPKNWFCVQGCGWEKVGVVEPARCPNCGAGVANREDYVMVFIDYSQMEVRMTAHYSRDPVLLEVYNVTHQDVHTRTMCESFGMDYDVAIKVLDDESHPDHEDWSFKRKASKITNFLIIYGGGAPNLAAQLSTPQKQYPKRQAQKFIDNYFKKFRGIKRWISDTRMQIRAHHEVQNHFGRYRRFPELKEAIRKSGWHWESKWVVERCERQGVNFLIQGTCADLFKIAMTRVHRTLKDAKTRLVMPIHDEIVFYWHQNEFGYLPEVVEQMQDFSFRVPMTVDVCWTTDNWAVKKALH